MDDRALVINTVFQATFLFPIPSDAQTLRRMECSCTVVSDQELANIFDGGEGKGYEKKWETIR